MTSIQNYINSGILELYVLGLTSEEENVEIEKIVTLYSEVSTEIENICNAVESYAQNNAIEPDPTLKPFLMATINYNQRLQNGEKPLVPPQLNEYAKISDYSEWINKPYMQLPADFHNFHAEIISITPEVTTAVVWIKYEAPEESHDKELEKFLILEGSCDLKVEDEIIFLKEGDFISIPLHKKHTVTITSSIPCKAIVQRIAA